MSASYHVFGLLHVPLRVECRCSHGLKGCLGHGNLPHAEIEALFASDGFLDQDVFHGQRTGVGSRAWPLTPIFL